MPPSDAQEAVQDMAKRLAAMEANAASQIIESYRPVNRNIRADIGRVSALAQKRKLKPWQIMRMTAMTTLRAQVVGELAIWHSVVNGIITDGQRTAVGLSQTGTRQIANAGLPRGIKLDNLARVGIEWNRLPVEAFRNFVGIAGDGKPIGNLLTRYGAENATRIADEIGSGIAQGKSPRDVARLASRATGMPLSEALLIGRTEINRAHREATRLSYVANSDIVKGYKRLATRDDVTCIACIALDGTLYENEEPLDAHPNCRCAMVPNTLTYEDMGLDIPEPDAPESAQAWFRKQPESTQRKMMKPRRFEAFKQGKVDLSDMVSISSNSIWGKSATVKSAKALGV